MKTTPSQLSLRVGQKGTSSCSYSLNILNLFARTHKVVLGVRDIIIILQFEEHFFVQITVHNIYIKITPVTQIFCNSLLFYSASGPSKSEVVIRHYIKQQKYHG
jgi:hypothetical protein